MSELKVSMESKYVFFLLIVVVNSSENKKNIHVSEN